MKKLILLLISTYFFTFAFASSLETSNKKKQINYVNSTNEKKFAEKTLEGKINKIKPKQTLTIKVYSQFIDKKIFSESSSFILKDSNLSTILQKNFNVQFEFLSTIEDTSQADIIILDTKSDFYKTNIESEAFLNWEKNDFLEKWAPYINKYLKAPLQKNRFSNSTKKYVHGLPTNISLFSTDIQNTTYTWNIKNEYFEQIINIIDNKEINTLDSLFDILLYIKDPSKIVKTNEESQENPDFTQNENIENAENTHTEKIAENKKTQTKNAVIPSAKKDEYALSLFKDSEKNPEYDLNIFAKELVNAYYGEESFYFGFYNPKSGKYQNITDTKSNYITALQFLNKLYQNNLINPQSEKYTKKQFIEEYQQNKPFWKYSTFFPEIQTNELENKIIQNQFVSVYPTEASPLIYGQTVFGSDNLWAISNSTKNPELCLAIINYLSTPEGTTSLLYGQKSENWEISNGQILLKKSLPENQIKNNNIITEFPISFESTNPLTKETSYNFMQKQNALQNQNLQNNYSYKNYTLLPITTYKTPPIPQDLQESYNKIKIIITSKSHSAIFAKDSESFNKIISEMKDEITKNEDWNTLANFFQTEAKNKSTLEKFVTGSKKTSSITTQ